jgi:hypothetical protein
MDDEPRTERLRRLLRQTLDEQLAEAPDAVDSNGRRRRLPGPWGLFFDEKGAWDRTARLSRALHLDLKGRFDDNLIREILLAAADVKISRASLTEPKLAELLTIAARHGFEIAASQNQFVLCADRGKGNWANSGRPAAEAGEAGAVRNVYIASDTTLAETGLMLDEAGEDDLFGALLGIPACCRQAFDRHKQLAARQQNDFVPYVLQNTGGAMPYDWRLNYVAQYFGFSLLSFFPCSFRCAAAVEAAEATLDLLKHCDAAWADQFVDLQKTNVLYTEYRGLHLFPGEMRDGRIAYRRQEVRSTEITELSELLRQGDRLEVHGKHEVHVYRGSARLGEIAGEDVCMCAFH